MKIRFLKTLTLDVESPRLEEVWYKTYPKWTELYIEEIYPSEKNATLKNENGDFILNVPLDAFEKLKEEKRTVVL